MQNFLVWVIVFIIGAVVVCRVVPDYYLEKYQTSTYMESGQIGDIVGGTTSPMIAIIASFLTFLAFWIQYKANESQRNDISLEHFENNLYEMIHIHRENLKDLCCGSNLGRDAICSFCYKLRLLYDLVNAIIKKLDKRDRKIFYTFCENKGYTYIEGKTIIAYNLLLYGANYLYALRFDSDEKKVYDKLVRIIERFESSRMVINKRESYNEETITQVNDQIYGFLEDDTSEVELDLGFDIDLSSNEKIIVPDFLLGGYNEKLGVYLRQLYQIVKFVLQRKQFTEEEKYSYIRMIRSQLSGHEQILLYYNGLSEIGKKWNQPISFESSNLQGKRKVKDWRENMGAIARYRLIKNIPLSFKMFGLTPERKYVDDIILYNKKNLDFFESERSVYS